MLEKQVRCPRTSSAGRLFDAVASIIGIRDQVSFEGQAAMELEFCAAADVQESYEYSVQGADPFVVDWAPMIRQILSEKESGTAAAAIAAKFQNTLSAIIVDIAHRVGEQRVLLTGGCFQNRYLTERTVHKLAAAGFTPYWHQRVPPNDGGIALGQVMAAHVNRAVRDRAHTREEQPCVSQFQAR
jgi:hydrogenase maturation protein HypF